MTDGEGMPGIPQEAAAEQAGLDARTDQKHLYRCLFYFQILPQELITGSAGLRSVTQTAQCSTQKVDVTVW